MMRADCRCIQPVKRYRSCQIRILYMPSLFTAKRQDEEKVQAGQNRHKAGCKVRLPDELKEGLCQYSSSYLDSEKNPAEFS